jgi:predicted nuclease of predicted toxin-antitoxin system
VKLLLDACVWGKATAELRAAGHDVVWAGDWTEDPGDEEILARAHSDERVLVTLDKDFGEMAVVRGKAHSGILRLVGIAAAKQAGYCMEVLERHSKELSSGAIITAETGRLRIRAPGTEPPSQGAS